MPSHLSLQRFCGSFCLFARCKSLAPVTCAIVHPCDKASLLGPIEAARMGLIVPVLVGPEAKIRAVAKEEGIDLSPYQIVAVEHSHEAATRAVAMARAGEVAVLMKGSLHTDELMGAVVSREGGLRTAAEWCDAERLAVAINMGMYATDFGSNVGYARADDHVNNGHWNSKYKSAFVCEPKEDRLPAAQLLDLDRSGSRPVVENYRTVVQNLRLIRHPGVNVWSKQDRRWSEAAVPWMIAGGPCSLGRLPSRERAADVRL